MDKMIFTFFLGSCLSIVLSVKIRTFYVPGRALNEAPLLCTYDLESAKLYDVKWYKDGSQFFRCEPNGDTTAFAVEGVKAQHIKFAPLGSCSPTLMMLTQKSAGEYKCEVSTEGPKFDTASVTRKMMIKEQRDVIRVDLSSAETSGQSGNDSIIQYHHHSENELVYDAGSSGIKIQLDIPLGVICIAAIGRFY